MSASSVFKNAIIVGTSRLIKLLANVTKLLSYVFHAVFPSKRFTLPEHAAPLLSPKGEPFIPRIIWQTNFTNRVTLPVYLNYLFNRLMAPRFEYRFMVTDARHQFIAENFNQEILASYERLQIGAAQADLWRLLVLQKHGGVYLDIDAHAIWPLARVVPENINELYVITRQGHFSNYFIASQPANPNLAKLIDRACANIETNESKNVFDITGPGVFNQELDQTNVPTVSYRHACNQGSFTNEYFQYIDKPAGKWTKEQKKVEVVAPKTSPRKP
ncbi:MAG: glycosyltransferase family 32 protein [Halomonadaceae bacterium]|uniref:Glycosyl transferase n=1 Tax=Halomonas colorata TaxID=2742615 RepID=A0ABR9G0C5_9GAMM|nr:glycosyltransferase [Halomonas colorata]MBE0464331.1 glycosyl transferase [Halomonas colorata]